MGMTSKEKARRYRERLKQNPEKLEERKQKKRESYHRNKILIADRNPQEKVNCRILWKLRKHEQRKRKKVLHNVLIETPPSSPSILQQHPMLPCPVTPPHLNSPAPSVISENSKKGRKKVRRDRSKLYRENKELKEENKKYEKYKKRLQRSKTKLKKPTETKDDDGKFAVLTNAIRDHYKKLRTNKEKLFLKNIFQSMDGTQKNLIIKEALGIENLRINVNVRKNSNLKNKINAFFLRDDVSRNTAGKKETVGRGNRKMQKRFLIDSMKNLYASFLSENKDVICSYYYFTRQRPYYVVQPIVDGRDMCLCKIHTNVTYKAKALKIKNIIKTFDLNMLIIMTVCDPKNKACMFETCEACKEKKMKVNDYDEESVIQWSEWVRQEEIYTKGGKKLKTIKNVKKTQEDTIGLV